MNGNYSDQEKNAKNREKQESRKRDAKQVQREKLTTREEIQTLLYLENHRILKPHDADLIGSDKLRQKRLRNRRRFREAAKK